MKRETVVVYGMVAASLLLVGGYMVVWSISSKRVAARAGKSDLMVERRVDRDFEALDSTGTKRKFYDLKGKVSLVSHVFTRCPGQCAGIGLVLDDLRKEYAGKGPLQLVSVSLDPEHDSPQQLAAFAAQHDLEDENWWFLTGDPEPLNLYMKEVFLLAAQPKPVEERSSPRDLFVHQPMVALVDAELKLRGWYFPFEEESAAELRRELSAALAEAGGKP